MPTSTEKQGARERLLDTASRLFYAEGVHTVGIDRILEESGVAKASLYKTFGSKDALILAYLDRRHERQVARITAAVESAGTPREQILAVFDSQARLFAQPDFRGCAFAAATAEGPVGSPTEEKSRVYRTYVRGVFRALAEEAGAADPDGLADQLHLVYDGAQMAARMDHQAPVAATARRTAEALLDAALGA
ncbi:TetR/AcrR family transcriptional regulator [Nocardioides sp. BP30]|uniref:TetR/AcrR family transcriptional regulator n=1 Tax=Nocardioides sp. BP30 TaxID=3036374 RepID=UPI0024688AF8|nr:TetR/AcrR family transcriptional regulator [Nocardioides sp. BP30]WGL53523.1 TetR/AcrR family transcriptional regulator [Nocardioides sp. BP30]